MSKISGPELTSYAGSIVAVGASLSLTQWGVIAGIVTALLTFAANAIYMWRKDAREQRQADLAEREAIARLAALGLKP
ncbi:HP1 family phage holin [Massilia sp. YIM B02769]|uniref:HP1 family phage holin n=1 Tax=Massilia sp. YIM B02769 TaxID=3050129 RepID=UPI0025B7362D|nr:HP1 family phage holin [Massilia sp. YIM B02769]MDN4061664.1 HP1 family phage holin [Massilia sp. YIM B02769]